MADVFSLGLLLFAMLHGFYPHVTSNDKYNIMDIKKRL